MRTFVLFLLVLAIIALLPSRGSSQSRPDAVSAQRVILQINRNLEVPGYLALEDDEVIAVRDLKGEVQSFAKSRVAEIVRLVDPQPGQTGIVIMRDGTVREGIIIEDAFDSVLIEIEGIRAKLKRDTVSHVVLQPTFEERYAQYKASLQPQMYDAHFALCRWLTEQRHYDLAKNELLELLEKTDMPEARKLLTLVEAQLALAAQPAASKPDSPKPTSQPSASQPEPESGTVDAADLMPTQLVSNNDVNIMRVYEIDFDHAPKVSIGPDAVRALIEKYGTNKLIPASQTGRNSLFRAAADNPIQVVRLMFELRARDMYPQVQVNTEPYALNLFRQRVHDTWLINNCATTHCHGGPFAGRLFLHRRNFKDDNVRYTNLLILERLKLDPEWPLINYDKPEDSLIIQYGLPRESARKPHPRVDGWKAVFSPINQKMKGDTIEWIRAMMQPRPDYPVDYEPPKLGGDHSDNTTRPDSPRPPR